MSALVNDQGPLTFALDTGASLTVISRRVARRAKVPITETAEAKAIGVGGKVEAILANVRSLQVGHVTAANLDVAVMPLTPISRALGSRLDGILGLNFLRPYRVMIDYPKQLLSLEVDD